MHDMETLLRIKSQFEIKEVDTQKGVMLCYPSIFNVVDSDREMVIPGAFTKTISEVGPGSAKPRIKHLWQHDRWQPIGIPQSMEEDKKGLLVASMFGKDQFSQDKLQQHIDGIITELSIGYSVIKSEKVMKTDTPDVVDYYKLLELKLWEYSSVTWGANSLTEIVAVKAGDKKSQLDILNERINKLCKGLRNPKYTDETLEGFELEIKQIQAIINEILLKQEPGKTTPEPGEESTLVKDLRQILFT